jgi:hypothetical protein
MLRTLILAGILAAAPALAAAEQPRLSDASYPVAARCLALAGLPQLQGDTFDVGALQAAFEAEEARRSPVAIAQARSAQRAARLAGRRTDEAGLLRMQRDQACASFINMGLAHRGGEHDPVG